MDRAYDSGRCRRPRGGPVPRARTGHRSRTRNSAIACISAGPSPLTQEA